MPDVSFTALTPLAFLGRSADVFADKTALVYGAFWEVFGPLEYWSGVGAWRWPQDGSTPAAALISGLTGGLSRNGSYTTQQAAAGS